MPACDSGVFFPVEVNFTATKTLCDVQVHALGPHPPALPAQAPIHALPFQLQVIAHPSCLCT